MFKFLVEHEDEWKNINLTVLSAYLYFVGEHLKYSQAVSHETYFHKRNLTVRFHLSCNYFYLNRKHILMLVQKKREPHMIYYRQFEQHVKIKEKLREECITLCLFQ